MVKQEAPGSARRPSSRSAKRSPHLSGGLKDLSLLDKAKSDTKADSVPLELHLGREGGQGHGQRGFPDRVYHMAAAIFQRSHVEKPPHLRLISFGKRSSNGNPLPGGGKDDWTQRSAYDLAFNTLKYQELLEDMMIDSCFYLSQPMPDDLMSLVAVMLYDFQDRKFLPREWPASGNEEKKADVRKVEDYLLKFKTKLAASLARCRIKHDLLTIDRMLPDTVRTSQERASSQPLYAWVNTLKTSLEEVLDLLTSEGFTQVKSPKQLEGLTFCRDAHCQDLLVFPSEQKPELYRTKLLSQHKLVLQDKSCCVGPWLAGNLLGAEGDILVAGATSITTVAHVAAIAAGKAPPGPGSNKRSGGSVTSGLCKGSNANASSSCKVFVCIGDLNAGKRVELQETLNDLGCKNVKLLPEAFQALDVSESYLQKVQLVLLTPQCSLSAVCNPVHYLLQENGDTELLQDLSHGSIAQEKMAALVAHQSKELKHALRIPRVQSVVYCTCSVYPEENEELVRRVLARGPTDEEQQDTPPFKPNSAVLSQQLSMESEVVASAAEVLARAAAKGLLEGIQTSTSTSTGTNASGSSNALSKKDKRSRSNHNHKHHRGQSRKAHASASTPNRVAEVYNNNRQTKASRSTPAMTGCHRSKASLQSLGGKSKPSHLQQQQHQTKIVSANKGSTYLTTSNSSTGNPTPRPSVSKAIPIRTPTAPTQGPGRTSTSSSSSLKPRTGPSEVLRPMPLMLPPAVFPGSPPPSAASHTAPLNNPTLPRAPNLPPVRSNPALSYLYWRNRESSSHHQHHHVASIPASRSSGSIHGIAIHPRPWL
ncbi:putative methyltransferase NSUN7 [Engraulis encrasicolus]|uniref:putative methyltransferase NSUN7 n=1 Tax=Engraulis encrasicolus TaxID=184585 RepID=UPI002FD1CC23